MEFQTTAPPIGGVRDRAPQNVQKFEKESFHRWYNFILGFSDVLVAEVLNELSVGSNATVLDAFCGTGTTLVECGKRGIKTVGIDANPFAIFAARTKSQYHLDPDRVRTNATNVKRRYKQLVSSNRRFSSDNTYLYLSESGMLDRGWISKKPLRKALALKEAINLCRDVASRDALLLALLADLPTNIGNMRFGPQIYVGAIKQDVDPLIYFSSRVAAICADLEEEGRESFEPTTAIVGDSRNLKPTLKKHYGENIPAIDFVICSPPYPTEHDYTRHTRLELAFLDKVESRIGLQSIKRTMIRSHTKGIYKGDVDPFRVKNLRSVEDLASRVQLAVAGKISGFEKLYPTVVRSYFGGMKCHFGSLFRLMRSGGKAAYVVGDQAAYLRVPIRTAALLGETAESAGFRVREIKLWRRRWASAISEYLDENILILEKP